VAVNADLIYRSADQIVNDLVTALLARIPDAQISVDSVWRIWIELSANVAEGIYLANQLLHNDMFIQTASYPALNRFGDEFGQPLKPGTIASGEVTFSGAGGTYIPIGTQVASPQSTGDTLIFLTTLDATVANPGIPVAPVAADLGTAGNLSGTLEWAVSFVTNAGETVLGNVSNALVMTNSRANLTAIPVGGPGTYARNVYRQKNGGAWQFVAQITDNTTTTYADNIADGSLGGAPPATSTAEAATVSAQAEHTGEQYNVQPGTITVISQFGGSGLTGVNNANLFSGGSDDEDMESYRLRLLDFIRNPKSGSCADLEMWAETVEGVESATAFPSVPQPGHVTVRISGPNSSIPDSTVQDAVLQELLAHDLANITIHVDTFTATVVNVSVTITTQSGLSVSEVRQTVIDAITDYINSIPVAGTVYVAGIYHAIFGLAGVATVVVTAPAADVVTDSTHKATVGTITVS
jgi:uncharacterized phage protein gp47/JayE